MRTPNTCQESSVPEEVVEWARQLASNHRTAVPTRIETHAHLGNFLAHLAGLYLAGDIARAKFQDLCVWAQLFLQNTVAAQGKTPQPMIVYRKD